MASVAVINARELLVCSGADATDDDVSSLGIIEDGALLSINGDVAWVGTTGEFRRKSFGKVGKVMDAGQGVVTPGFVDPHTHLVFSGSREDELERKGRGESYTSILKSGGGILKTFRETGRSSVSKIVEQSKSRLNQLQANGVTTIEVKTGYGGRLKEEIKLLKSIAALRRSAGADLTATFLGLHAKHPEFRTSGDHVDYAIKRMLPFIAGLRDRPAFSDCFCEEGVFSRDECARYLSASKRLRFALKIHADEFSDTKGASLAAEAGCTSADHLGYADHEGVLKMAREGVVPVLLPTTSLYSGIKYADAQAFVKAGCRVALGTDLSPNSWVESPQIVMAVACTALKLSPAQSVMGFTSNAAAAIGRKDIGSLEVGKRADFVVHSVPSYRFLPYRVGGRYVSKVVRCGKVVFDAAAA
ncbi:MAG: imidazolonepropionase [Thaumarchaeota archaeon]|nr:imidazolonepropionase [Nitrososphaerota archaeon]